MGKKRKGTKTKQRDKLKEFSKLKERQKVLLPVETLYENTEAYNGVNNISYVPVTATSESTYGSTDESSELKGKDANNGLCMEVYMNSNTIETGFAESIDSDGDLKGSLNDTRKHVVILAMFIGVFLAAMDGTVVTTLVDRIASEFEVLQQIAWVSVAYLIACAICQPLYGKLSDIFGRVPLLVFCNIIFGVGCTMCALARGFWWLVFGRFFSGIGGGGLNTLCAIILTDMIPLRSRGLYQGMANIAWGLGTASGGVIAGYFTELGGGWRTTFAIQVPMILFSAYLITNYCILPSDSFMSSSSPKRSSWHMLSQVDWIGSFFSVIFLGMLTFVCSFYQDLSSAMLATSLCVITLSGCYFVHHELSVAADPVLPLAFLKNRTVLCVSLGLAFIMMAAMVSSFYVPFYLGSVLNYNPYEVGQRLIPTFFSASLGSLFAGYYMKKTGTYTGFLRVGCIIAICGSIQLFTVQTTMATWRQFTLMFIPGLGHSVIITISLMVILAAVPHKDQAATTSLVYTFRTCGSTLGLSFASVLFNVKLDYLLRSNILPLADDLHPKEELLHIIERASQSPKWVHEKSPAFARSILIQCYNYACSKYVFGFCMFTASISSICLLFAKEYKLHSSISRRASEVH